MIELRPYDGPIVTRAEARAEGLTRYFTGEPCKHGHRSERYTKNTKCCECRSLGGLALYARTKSTRLEASYKWRAANLDRVNELRRLRRQADPVKARQDDRRWREADPDRRRALERERYAENVTHHRQMKAAWRKNNREKARASVDKWRYANPDKHRLNTRKWRLANPELARANDLNRKARERDAEGTHLAEDIRRIGNAQGWRCAWCRAKCKKNYHVDHVIPLSKGGSNWPSNLVISCQLCNLKKHAKDPLDFARELGRLL